MFAVLLLLLLLFLPFSLSSVSISGDESFDVRQHLSTVSRYAAVKDIVNSSYVPAHIPASCQPIHLNLLGRHGTRAPTEGSMEELDRLASSIEAHIAEAKQHKSSLKKVPSWLFGWTSPWKGNVNAGELLDEGEDELYNFGHRVRQKYSKLMRDRYYPLVYAIKATQVARTSVSAVAFAMALFKGRGNLGPAKLRAFSVSTESRASDICLRFYDNCQSYKSYKEKEKPAVKKLKEPVYDEITSSLSERYQLNFTRQDISSLWLLCKQEASLLGITNQACGLFNRAEIDLLEWTEDLEVFLLKGCGNPVNYLMALPLLKDIMESMELAINATEEALPSGSYEKARLQFAHAETLVPFSCLLGLYLQESEYSQIQRGEALEVPQKPPKTRNWKSSILTPFAGNIMLVLYQCPAKKTNEYYVHALHNEQPIPLPGCNNSDFCPFEVFKERIVKPHIKEEYDDICKVKQQNVENKQTATSRLSWTFGRLFSSD